MSQNNLILFHLQWIFSPNPKGSIPTIFNWCLRWKSIPRAQFPQFSIDAYSQGLNSHNFQLMLTVEKYPKGSIPTIFNWCLRWKSIPRTQFPQFSIDVYGGKVYGFTNSELLLKEWKCNVLVSMMLGTIRGIRSFRYENFRSDKMLPTNWWGEWFYWKSLDMVNLKHSLEVR
jgi:hypothetical protein